MPDVASVADRGRTLTPRQTAGLVGLIVCSAGVFALAHALPPHAGEDLLYLVPVGLMAWTFGRAWGLVFGFVAAVLRLFDADLSLLTSASTPWPIVAWNIGSALAEYASASLVIGALRAAHRRERHAARHDELTGLLNRRAFYEACAPWCMERTGRVTAATAVVARRLSHWRGALWLSAARRNRRPTLAGRSGVALAYLDLDGFKGVNDTHGHASGDLVLRSVAAAVLRATRTTDVCARLGGDEFAVLLPGASLDGASTVANRLLDEIRATMRGEGWPVDASVGVAVFPSPPASVDALVRAADALMYAVKQTGKGRLAVRVVKDAA